MKTQPTLPRRTVRTAGAFATIVGATMLAWATVAPVAQSAYSTALAAEPGQTPMPDAVTPVPENCKGIAPTPGSKNDTTQKQLNEGQGIIKPAPNSFDPGGTVHFIVLYNATDKSASFDIRDCVVVFLPGNPHIPEVLALADGHGQLIPTPGSTPAVKGYDAVVDNAQFAFPDKVALPGEFDLSWTVPSNAVPGSLICNYAKDTGGSDVGGKENRKAGGACFSVPMPPPTTTSSTTTSSTTTSSTTTPPPPTTSSTMTQPTTVPEVTTTSQATTTTTQAPTTSTSVTPITSLATPVSSTTTPVSPAVATTVPTQVLGESFAKAPLAFTGAEEARMVAVAGAALSTGGLLLLVASRRRDSAQARR